MNDIIRRALSLGFPTYIENERDSFPKNSSPYRMSLTQLKSSFAHDNARSKLLELAEGHLALLSENYIHFPAMLIGGGFVRRLPDPPSDLDALVFYRLENEGTDSAITALAGSHKVAKQNGLDLRYCPLDSDPIAMIQSISFFTILYTKPKGEMRISNGLILCELTA